MSASMEDRLKRRKLDALKRGVHRVSGDATPVATQVVGIGRAGASVIAEILRGIEPDAPKFTAFAIDIGGDDLAELRRLAAELPAERVEVTIVALDEPRRDELFGALERYRDFLRLEYPSYRWNPEHQPWLPRSVDLPKADDHVKRAVAKAIYGQAYYSGSRALQRKLRDFAAGVDSDQGQAVVAIVFGIGGGTGSGIAVDLARHLSNVIFGRRVLVAGIGIAPCTGDLPEHIGAHLFPVINELDCLADEEKNRGVVISCGELFRNPFTAGFLMVPQQPGWESTRSLTETQSRGTREIASLLMRRGGSDFLEVLRLLNWVAAPSTQHSAARTPWGPRWIHMLGFADTAGQPITLGPMLRNQLGLLDEYSPQFIEMRVPDASGPGVATLAAKLEAAFSPDVPPQVVDGGRPGSVQFILPSVSKLDLRVFHSARSAYDAAEAGDKLLDHSLLLEQGVLLCEPSTRVEGMAGASLWGGTGWTAVPLDALRGDGTQHASRNAALRALSLDQAV